MKYTHAISTVFKAMENFRKFLAINILYTILYSIYSKHDVNCLVNKSLIIYRHLYKWNVNRLLKFKWFALILRMQTLMLRFKKKNFDIRVSLYRDIRVMHTPDRTRDPPQKDGMVIFLS